MKKLDTNIVKIAIVDDHTLFRKGLVQLINLGDVNNKYVIVFEAGDGDEMISKLSGPLLPDIIIMDINMPNKDGFEATEWLKRTYPEIKVLVITMSEDEKSVLRMLRLGVKGFLPKDIEVEQMHQALNTIVDNGFYYSDFATDILTKNLNGHTNQQQSILLSENERQFLKLAPTDLTYQQIADEMNLSVKTIDGYREALFKKLGAKSRTTVVLAAARLGLIRIL
jgi:two-component system, NarL family, invasion response regulator UvrY